MNKADLINVVAANAGLTKTDARKAVDAVLEAVKNELKVGGKISLVGFGTFSVVEKAARKGLNPRTKQVISIPAKKVCKFKPGADLQL
jgi:Bacterial nucleoid DNA-binding protein